MKNMVKKKEEERDGKLDPRLYERAECVRK
jgi:hypothetical protein